MFSHWLGSGLQAFASALTRILARAHVHPNTVTLASWVFAIAAMWWSATAGIERGLSAQ